ncbi:MAG: response regulator, partial [Fimbriimonadaceae bacterium]|nr:response regulator [Fimbriimonadaceae bacterium]
VGSTFWIEDPLESRAPKELDLVAALSTLPKFGAATVAARTNAHSNVHKLRRARVLVAEDNATNQRVAQLILESGGHAVTIVDNGEGALDALERGGFDIALFDLSMPVVSGLEALKLYRFTNPCPIPILIVSANVTAEIIAETLEGGAAEFVPKPLRASHLLDAIDRHLAQRIESPTHPPPRSEDRASLSLVELPVLDQSVLDDLSRLSSDSTFMSRLLRGFRCDTERLVKEIAEHITKREYALVRDAAHALKGGAASVGASHLVQQATTLEKMPSESLRIRSAYFIEELTRTSNRTIDVLELVLEKLDQSAAKDNKLGS